MARKQKLLLVATALLLAVDWSCGQRPARRSSPEDSSVPEPPEVQVRRIPEETATTVLYVDGQSAAASDENPGAARLPFRTISRAAQRAHENKRRGIGTKVLIRPGVYREQVILPIKEGETTAPLIFEAAVGGKVILSGSDVWTGWQRVEGNVYRHAWPYHWGMAPYPRGWEGEVILPPVVRRREMVFLNGTLLEQALAYRDLKDNSFYVSEQDSTLYLRAAPGLDVEKAAIEVSTRSPLFRAQSQHNLVLRGMQFVQGNTPLSEGAVAITDSSDVLIANCDFSWNSSIGLLASGVSNLTLRHNSANHNGAAGIDGYQWKRAFLEGNETSYNNWRGAWGGFTGWAPAGTKVALLHEGTIRDHRSFGNQCRGFWLDSDNSHVTVEGALWCRNLRDGVFVEANAGPILIRNSVIAGNQNGSGIAGANSAGVSLVRNLIYGNARSQIEITGVLDRTVTDWETGATRNVQASHWTLRENLVASSEPAQPLLLTPNWKPFRATLNSEGNPWEHPGGGRPFRVGPFSLTLAQWQFLTGSEAHSVLTNTLAEDADLRRLLSPEPAEGAGVSERQ